MTQYEPDTIETDELPTDAMYLGTDANKLVHRYSRHRNNVYVGEPDADELAVFNLDEYPLVNPRNVEGWVEIVHSRRGWDECQYVETAGDWLANLSVEEAV